MRKKGCIFVCVFLMLASRFAFAIEQRIDHPGTDQIAPVPGFDLDIRAAQGVDWCDEEQAFRRVKGWMRSHGIVTTNQRPTFNVGCYRGVDVLLVGPACYVKVCLHRPGTYEIERMILQIWYTRLQDGDISIIADCFGLCR